MNKLDMNKLDRIKNDISKVKLKIKEPVPKHLQNDEKYVINIFKNNYKTIQKLLKDVNSLNQKNIDVLVVKKELIEYKKYLGNFIKIFC